MKRILIFIISITALLCGTVVSQTDGNELLKKLQQKFDSIKDLSADFTQTNNGKTIFSGSLLFKKENKFKITTEKFIIVSDGTTSWSYNKKENKVIITNYDDEDPGVFSLNELVYVFPEQCDVISKIENQESVLILTPNSYKYNFDSVQIWLNNEDLISKVLLTEYASGKTAVVFSNYRLNQNLPDSKYSFTPPEGSKIIDLR